MYIIPIIKALAKDLPESLGVLLKVHDGLRWFYLDSLAALKLAGYTIQKEKTHV